MNSNHHRDLKEGVSKEKELHEKVPGKNCVRGCIDYNY